MPWGAIASAAIPVVGNLIGGLFSGNAAKKAAKKIEDANLTSTRNVEDATRQGQAGVTGQLNDAATAGGAARDAAVGDVRGATEGANNTLQTGLNNEVGNLSPYLDAGRQGVSSLAQYAASNPQFKFDPTQEELENTPGYKFQLAQGANAVNNSASAQGLLQSGNTLEALNNYGTGLAGTYYQNAFKNAHDTFTTNQNSTLQNLATLAGIGMQGTNQYNSALENAGNRMASNTLGAGYYSGNTGIDMSKYLSNLGMQGQEFDANLGLGGANDAAKYRNAAAGGAAVGTVGSANSLQSGVNGALNGLPALLKALKLGGGGGYGPAGPPPPGGGGYG